MIKKIKIKQMLLILRRNFFYRSFWQLKKISKFTHTSLKYFDLDAINTKAFKEWQKISRVKIHSFYPFFSFDASYWNTYHATIPHNNLLSLLIDYCLSESFIDSVKNFRTDNMSSQDFELLVGSTMFPEYFNNNWKTAHINHFIETNPHWNLYHYEPNPESSDNDFLKFI